MESHYVMNEPVNDDSLRYFIISFTNNTLRRSLSSTATIKESRNPIVSKNAVQIEELNTSNFLSTVMETNRVSSM